MGNVEGQHARASALLLEPPAHLGGDLHEFYAAGGADGKCIHGGKLRVTGCELRVSSCNLEYKVGVTCADS